jgi:hypothetical protein
VPGALVNRTVPEIRPTFLTEQPGPDSTVMRIFPLETRIGVCETSSACSSGSSLRKQPAPVLAGVKVVRAVGRSTLTPAPGRRTHSATRRKWKVGA